MNANQTMLLSLILTTGIIIFVAPKNSSLFSFKKNQKVAPPKSASNEKLNEKRQTENGSIIITAMRNLINDGGSQEDANKLQAEFQKQYGLKTYFDNNNKLLAKDKSGKVVAKE